MADPITISALARQSMRGGKSSMPGFSGSFEDLKDRLLVAGIDGEWHERDNGIWQLKGPDGANMSWSSTRGTIWCDGKQPARADLEAKVAAALGTSFDEKAAAPARPQRTAASRKVFVVYGHDTAARTSLEAMLRRWDLEPL